MPCAPQGNDADDPPPFGEYHRNEDVLHPPGGHPPFFAIHRPGIPDHDRTSRKQDDVAKIDAVLLQI
jgi:hypothetical protein